MLTGGGRRYVWSMSFLSSPRLAILFALVSCGGIVDDDSARRPNEPGPSPGSEQSGTPSPSAPALPDSPPCTTAPAGVETIVDLATSPGDLGTTTGPIVVDDRYVFTDTNRGLFRAPKCGGPAVRIAENSPGQYSASGLVQDASFIYLAATAPVRGGFVRRIAKDGSGVVELASSTGELFGLALARPPSEDVARLYWTEKNASSGTVRSLRLLAGATADTVATIPIAYSFGPFAADASGVTFFALDGSNHGTFYRHPWTGIERLGRGATPYAITSDATYFTFGHTGANGVARLASTERVAEAKAPCGLAKRDDTLFWSDMSRRTIERCQLADASSCNAIRVISSGEDDPRQVAVDDIAVYWATRRGLLRRAPH